MADTSCFSGPGAGQCIVWPAIDNVRLRAANAANTNKPVSILSVELAPITPIGCCSFVPANRIMFVVARNSSAFKGFFWLGRRAGMMHLANGAARRQFAS